MCENFDKVLIHLFGVSVHRFQGKFKHLWDAAERSVRSAQAPTLRQSYSADRLAPAAGPLEQALSARPDDMLQSKESGVEASRGSVIPAQSMRKQDSTLMTLTGRLGSLFPSRRSSVANYMQHQDDLSGSSYMYRDY